MQLLSAMYLMGCLQVLYMACKAAYEIRLYAIEEYGRVIHEFDPYFNYRATEYLWQHGWKKFFQWFDYQSWYPLGRSVGTTIYPGMQFTSVWIKQFILPNWSINDICCFLPAWFGVLATLSTAGLAYVTVVSIKKSKKHSFLQDIPLINTIYDAVVVPIVQAMVKFVEKVTGSTWGMPTSRNPPALESAVFTACIMSIVPAHLLRSVGGGYDNESVATTAMQLTFLMWTVTCYAPERFSIPLGVLTAIAYFYMVAAWGGYIFVINLVGIHAAFLIVFQTMPWTKLYKSYTSFYFIGTLLAMQVPVVNWAPLRSLEQLGPCGVFSGMQVLQLMRVLERRYPRVNRWKVRGLVVAACLMLAGPVVFVLYDRGYFGPLSSRVRGLFVEHTKTGNPLVDSVAEHQAASPQAYYQYLNEVVNIAPIGLAIVVLYACTPASSFLLLYGVAAYFFSHKMVRLILLTAPIASVCGGIALGYTWAWMVGAIFGDDRPSLEGLFMGDDDEEVEEPRIIEAKLEPEGPKKRGGKGKKKEPTVKASAKDDTPIPDENEVPPAKKSDPLWVRAIRLFVSYWIIRQIIPTVKEFHTRAHEMAKGISHPTIISKGKLSNGDEVLIDDYRQAYLWLKDNTPEDARIMAWWDYGYQITGIANRTTIADGNTWNHEHIALLGRILTSPEKDGHRIARHLADYVLIWAGGGGDDLAKSPHLIRIANSVYRGMCKEPTCRTFGMMVRLDSCALFLLVFRCDLYSNF
jgi:dolichyl-diphosphooligosaccharide--protein glycosyltransferase